MLFVGYSMLHLLFGFPELEMAGSYIALSVATVSAALGAVGFGLLVGSGSRTHSQAALFGSVMVVILGVISGTFLPIHVMPKAIQFISSISPIRWGIDNYIELFVRDGSLIDILPGVLWLLLFFIFALLISMFIFAKRN
jgi:ABC-2 type transport system permease protein